MKLKRILAITLCLILALGLLAGCGGDTGGSDAGGGDAGGGDSSGGDTITFGLNYELTGDNPIIGQSSIDGVNLAIEEINNAGGIKIGDKSYILAVKPLDNEFKQESAAVVTQTFADDDSIVAMIGPNDSAMCLGSAAIVESEGLPTITP